MSVEPAAEAAHKGPHFPCFDGLRAIAAVTVLMVHTTFASGFAPKNLKTWAPYTSRLEIGVSVFFLISGFLLYRPFVDATLTGRRRPDTASFYKRRLLRIVPAYWVALTASAYVFHQVNMGPGLKGFFIHYGFVQIYSHSQVSKGMAIAWSLCTELSFYAFLPLYAWLLSRRLRSPQQQLKVEMAGVVVLVLVSVVFRIYSHKAAPLGLQPLMPTWLPAYLDLFAAGMFLAVTRTWTHHHGQEPAWLGRRWLPWASWGLAGAAYLLVCNIGLPVVAVYHDVLGPALERQTLYGLFAFFLLLPAVFGPQDGGLVRRFLRARPVAYVGLVSYGVYVWHELFIAEYRDLTNHRLFSQPLVPLSLVTLGLSVAVATLSYRLVELPFLQLKDRTLWSRRLPVSPRPPA